MRIVFFVLFWIVFLLEVPRTDSFNLKSRLSSTDQHHVSQLNTIRSFVGSGYIKREFADAIKWFLDLVKLGKAFFGALSSAWGAVTKFFSDVGSFFGLRHRRAIDKFDKPGSQFKDNEPIKAASEPLLGPATKMIELRWNKRLSQKVYADMKYLTAGKAYEYRNKTYRAFQHGSMFEAVANDFLPFLKSIIDNLKMIWTVVKLLLTEIHNPPKSESEVIDTMFEYLFEDYVEVGCGTNMDGSWCLIGPTKNRNAKVVGVKIITNGRQCSECKTECVEGMCRAKPDYEDQNRLREIIKGKSIIVEEVVVEEVTVMPPELEEDSATALRSALLFVSLFVMLLTAF